MAQKNLQRMLRWLVQTAGMSAVDVARAAGVSQPHVSRLMGGAPTRQYDMGKRIERLYERAVARRAGGRKR